MPRTTSIKFTYKSRVPLNTSKGPFTQAIFVAATRCNFFCVKLQLQNRTCKQGAIRSAICRRDIAGFSNMFETCCNFSVTKIASSCRDKNRLCKRAFTNRVRVPYCTCQLRTEFFPIDLWPAIPGFVFQCKTGRICL